MKADPEIERLRADLREANDAIRELQQEACDRAGVPMPSQRPLVERLRADKDAAYLERNQAVAALASVFPAGIARTDIPGWLPEWHGCVYIDLPTGQASWHYHDSHAHLFAHLPPYAGKWDGHTTEEKYARLAALAAAVPIDPAAEKMWLWRDGKDRFLAFRSLFPLMPDCGDPAVIGQPSGYAFYHPMTLAEAQKVSHEARIAAVSPKATD